MEKMTLWLTRHGETLENKRHILQGQLPGTLSELGLRQAEELADRLETVPLDGIVSSDLARSRETAERVARRKGMTVYSTPLLREMDWGRYTGGVFEEVDWAYLPEGVESVEGLYERAGKLLRELAERYAGKRVLAVGHGAFNRAVKCYAEGRNPYDMLELPIMGNTEIMVLEYGLE